MATVASHALKPFVSPFQGPQPATANDVRGNDNQLRVYHNAHDADASIHMQSGTLANRPASLAEGSTYFCTDTRDTYTYTGSAWVQSAWAHWHGDVYDTTDQPAAVINTPQLVTFNSTGILRGVSLASSSQVTVAYAGDYNAQFSAQLLNTDSSEHDVWFWYAKNGTALADGAGRVTIQKKHGSVDGHLIVGWNVNVTLAVTDYLQLYWESTGTTVSLETIPAAGSIPRSPSVIFTINRI